LRFVISMVFNDNSRARLFTEELLMLDYLNKNLVCFTQFNNLTLELIAN